MYENIEKIKVIVFVNKYEIHKYGKLFIFLLGDKVQSVKGTRDEVKIDTSDCSIHIMNLGESKRGYRAHYVINMVQDAELNNLVAMPIERFDQLRFSRKFNFLT